MSERSASRDGRTAPDPLTPLLDELAALPAEARAQRLEALCAEHAALAADLRARSAELAARDLFADGPADATAAAGMPAEIAGFRPLRRLGGGGMGVVFRARQQSLGRDVALKLIRPELAPFGDLRDRFKREAEAIARLDHPGIVPVYEFGDAGGIAFLAMAFVDGCSLADVIEVLAARAIEPRTLRPRDLAGAIAASLDGADAGAFATAFGPDDAGYPAAVTRIVLGVAEALAHAHARGVVHRDVKPSNVMIARDGRPMLVDFGIASAAGSTRITGTGTQLGSLPYSSPEQISGGLVEVDHRTDVFSLGAVLYELLALRQAFEAGNLKDALRAIVSREPADLVRVNPAVGPDLAAIVAKCLEKQPARRYGSAAALASDLRAFLEHRPIAAARLTARVRLLRFVRREPLRAALWSVATASALVVTGLLGYLLARQDAIAAGRSKLDADAREAVLARGFLMLAHGDEDSARAAFDEALARWPGSGEALAGLRALGAGPSPVTGAPGASSTPFELFAHAMEALFVAERGDPRAAQRALALLEAATLRSPVARPTWHFALAMAAARAGEPAAARRAADAVVALWPDSAYAHYWAGYALLEVDAARAAHELAHAARLDDGLAPAHGDLGIAALRNGDVALALRSLRRATELAPRDARAWINLGTAHAAAGDEASAIEALRCATEVGPELPGAHYNYALALSARDAPAAIEAYRRATELEPRYAEAWNNLGALQLARGDHAAAAGSFRQLVALLPESAPAWQGLGAALAAAGDVAGCVDAYQRVVTLAPDDAEAHEYLCRLLEHRGDADALAAERARWARRGGR